MQIVIKAENGTIYFNPQSIEFVENRTTTRGECVSTIILTFPGKRVAVSDNYPLRTVKAVVNEIYRVLDETVISNCFCFDIKALIEEFQDQEK